MVCLVCFHLAYPSRDIQMNAYSLQEKKTKHCRYPNVALESYLQGQSFHKLNTMEAVGYDGNLESFLDEGLGAEDAQGVRKAKPIIPFNVVSVWKHGDGWKLSPAPGCLRSGLGCEGFWQPMERAADVTEDCYPVSSTAWPSHSLLTPSCPSLGGFIGIGPSSSAQGFQWGKSMVI